MTNKILPFFFFSFSSHKLQQINQIFIISWLFFSFLLYHRQFCSSKKKKLLTPKIFDEYIKQINFFVPFIILVYLFFSFFLPVFVSYQILSPKITSQYLKKSTKKANLMFVVVVGFFFSRKHKFT